jgi:hypothetical protein
MLLFFAKIHKPLENSQDAGCSTRVGVGEPRTP